VDELHRVERMQRRLSEEPDGLTPERFREAKELGFSDRGIARAIRRDEEEVRRRRLALGLRPRIRMIDTLAGEWPSQTNYLYLTYRADADDVTPVSPGSILVLGAGPYRIGSSVEFDWSTMNLVDSLRAEGVPKVAVLNSNPETVSTDYDRSDRLYFEEITLERVRDIYEFEQFSGVVTSVGSQVAQNLTPLLDACPSRSWAPPPRRSTRPRTAPSSPGSSRNWRSPSPPGGRSRPWNRRANSPTLSATRSWSGPPTC
ncbi:carbamoylphosphate synthase, partial [mine drainage metagenome]